MKALVLFVIAVFLASSAAAAEKSSPKTLGPGSYAAKVAVLPCAGCADKVEETMKAVAGIADVSVNGEMSSVVFTVKAGAKVEVAQLQERLKTASAKMGMGADYSLDGIIEHPSGASVDAKGKPKSKKPGCSNCKSKH